MSLSRLANEVRFKTYGKLRDVRPDELHLLTILSERRAVPLDDKIVSAGDFLCGVNEWASIDASLELPQTFRRGPMIESHTDDYGKVGDEMLLQSVRDCPRDGTETEAAFVLMNSLGFVLRRGVVLPAPHSFL